MKSPLFSEHFEKDNWTLAYFNALREAFTKTRDEQIWSRCSAKKGTLTSVGVKRKIAKIRCFLNFQNQVAQRHRHPL